MRKFLTGLMVLGIVACVAGCSSAASEDKPLDEVKAEAQKMDAEQLKAKIAEYEEAIKAKQPEIDQLKKDLGAGLTGVLSGKKPDNADDLQAKLDELQASVTALTERMQIYADELKKKQGA